MKKWLKVFTGIVVVLILLAIGLVVLANVLITPERVKETLLPLAEENLNRKIELGDIEVSLFSGIEIHGLTLYEQNNKDVFVSTDLVRLKYQLLPLLAMKVVVDEVRLEKPTIRIVRLKDGQFNFSDLTEGSDSDTNQTDSSKDDRSQGAQGGTSISLLVSNLLLQDGQLTFLDHVLNDEAPYRYEITDLQVAAKGVSLSGKIPLSMQCQLNGSQLTLDGHVNLQPLGGDFTIELQGLDIVAFNPYLKDVLPGKLGGLKLTLKSNFSGTLDDVALKGTVSFAELNLLLDAMPEAPLKNVSLGIDYDLLFASNQRLLQLNQLDLDYNGIKVGAKGKVASLIDNPTLDLTLTVPDLQIREAINAVPQSLVGDVRDLDPAGSLSVEAILFGGIDDALSLLKSATVDLDSVQATVGGQRPAFSGRLLLAGDKVRSDGLQVRLGDNNADINLKAKHLFSTPVIVNLDISSERFLLEPLLQGSAAPVAVSDQSEAGLAQKVTAEVEIGPFDIPLQASGTISIAEALWKDLTIRDFFAQYELKNNVFSLTRMDGQLAGGSFSNTARVDLGKKGLAYSAKLGLKTIQADPLLTAFVPKAAGSLLGAVDMSFTLDGRGTQWEKLKRNLSGTGDMLVADGRLVSPGLVNGLSNFLQLSELNDIQFDNFKGKFKIKNGIVELDSQLLSDKLKLFPKGAVGLDGSLNLGLDTRLSPELSAKLDKKGGVTRYLADQDGWTRMPLLLKGSFAAPSFGLDPKGMQEQASKAISNELGRQVDKLFKRSEPASQETGDDSQPAEDPMQKLLQDSLQKLFGN